MIKLHEVKLHFNKITVASEMSRVHHQILLPFFGQNLVILYACTGQCGIIGRVITVMMAKVTSTLALIQRVLTRYQLTAGDFFCMEISIKSLQKESPLVGICCSCIYKLFSIHPLSSS